MAVGSCRGEVEAARIGPVIDDPWWVPAGGREEAQAREGCSPFTDWGWVLERYGHSSAQLTHTKPRV